MPSSRPPEVCLSTPQLKRAGGSNPTSAPRASLLRGGTRPWSSAATVGRSAPGRPARRGIEEEALKPLGATVRLVGEREEVVEASGFLVEGRVANPTGLPVVLDEAQDRGLVGHGVVDKVGLREGGDHDQGQPRTIAAPVLVTAGDAAGVGTASAGVSQRIVRGIV